MWSELTPDVYTINSSIGISHPKVLPSSVMKHRPSMAWSADILDADFGWSDMLSKRALFIAKGLKNGVFLSSSDVDIDIAGIYIWTDEPHLRCSASDRLPSSLSH